MYIRLHLLESGPGIFCFLFIFSFLCLFSYILNPVLAYLSVLYVYISVVCYIGIYMLEE
jgi:hypothetical protein